MKIKITLDQSEELTQKNTNKDYVKLFSTRNPQMQLPPNATRRRPHDGAPTDQRTGLHFADYVESELKTIFMGFAADFSSIRWDGVREESTYQAVSCIRLLYATAQRMVAEIELFRTSGDQST